MRTLLCSIKNNKTKNLSETPIFSKKTQKNRKFLSFFIYFLVKNDFREVVMKYVISFFGIACIVLGVVLFGGNKSQNTQEESVRIHVVANSNSSYDEEVKYFVKDVVVTFLEKELQNFENSKEVKNYLVCNIEKLQDVVGLALKEKGVSYGAKIFLIKEEMPARVYDNQVFDEGVYDSLKIELGNAKGENWWCVVFPSVCFISSKNFQNFEYKSKIWDILSNVI